MSIDDAFERAGDQLNEDELPEQCKTLLAQSSEHWQMFRALLDSTQDVVLFKDRDSVYLLCSEEFSRLHDLPMDKVVGKTVADLFPAEQAERFRAEDVWVMETDQKLVAEHQWQTSQGLRWYEAVKHPLRDGDGNVAGVFSLEREITERKQSEERLRRYANGMAALNQTMLEINAHRDIDTLLQAIIQRAAELAGAQVGTINLLRSDGQTQEVVAVHSLPPEIMDVIYDMDKGASGVAIQTGKPFTIENYGEWTGRVSPFDRLGFGRVLAVPFKSGEGIIGSLVIGDADRIDRFDEEIVRLIGMFADQAALALQNAKLYEASQLMVADRTAQLEVANKALEEDIAQRRQVEDLLRIQRDLAVILSSTDELDEALGYCVQAILQVTGIGAAGIYVVDHDKGTIELRSYHGLSDAVIADVRNLERDLPQVQLIEAGHSLYVGQDNMPASFSGFCERSGLRAVALIPVLYQGRAIACIYAGSRTCDDIPGNSRHALESIAAQIGAVIARLNMNAALRRNQENLQTLFDTIDDFLVVVDSSSCIVDVNQVLLGRLGYDREELIGYPVSKLHPPERRVEAEKILEDILEKKVDVCNIPLVDRDGLALAVETKVTHGRWNSQDVLFGICRDVTEREETRKALEQSEARYRAIVEDQTDLICRYLPDGTLTFVNEAYCRYFGKNCDELIGTTFFTLVSELDLERVKQIIASFSQDNPVIMSEHRVSRPGNDEVVWQQWIDRAIFDQHGALIEFQAVGRDITDRKRAEIERDEQQRLMRALLDALPDFVAFKDRDSTFRMCNQTVCDFLDLPQEEIIGKTDFELFPIEDATSYRQEELHVMETGESLTVEHELRGPNGLRRWHEAIKSPLLDQNGDIIGVLTTGWDITERLQAKAERDEQQRMLRTLLDTVPDFIIVKDLDLNYIMANKRYCEAYGVSEAEIIGKSDFDLVLRSEDAEAFQKEDLLVISSGEPVVDRHVCETPIGTRWDESIRVPLRGPDGKIMGVLVAARDITDRMQVEMERDEQRRMLQALLETTLDTVVFKDCDSRYLASSETCRLMTAPDIPVDQFIGLTDFDLFPEEQARAYREEEVRVMTSGEILKAEHKIDTPYGPRWFEAVKSPLRNEQGEIIGTFTSEREVTERLQIQAELDDQNRRLRTLLDTLPDHIIFKDLDLVYRVVNQSYCDFWDCPMDEMVGKSDWDIWPEEEAKRYRAEEFELIRTGEPMHMEKYMMTARGPNYREIVKTPLRDSNGEIIGVLFAAHDITALKLAEERLKRRNKELATLNAVSAATSQSMDLERVLKNVLKNILWVDIAGEHPQAEIFLLDDRSENVVQLAHVNVPEEYLENSQARGRHLCQLVAEQGQQVSISDEARLKEAGPGGAEAMPHRNLCLPLRTRDRIFGCINLWLPLDRSITQEDFFFLRSVSDQIGVAIENAKLYEDIRQQNRRVRALSQQLTESAENERRRLAQDLHDMVGQYLAALGINLGILQGMLPADLPEKAKARIEESLSLVEQTTECIRGVMSDLRPPVLDDYGLLVALDWYAERFSKRMSVTVRVVGEPLEARLPVQIENILFRVAQEALTNVGKHAQASSAEVVLSEADGMIRLEISDNGIGFDPEELSARSEDRGWGLLTIREWVETLGGQCHTESTPGLGTQIIIELERAESWQSMR